MTELGERETQRLFNIQYDYAQIIGDKELEKRNLAYEDFKRINSVIKKLEDGEYFLEKSKNMAEWLESFGCEVKRYRKSLFIIKL